VFFDGIVDVGVYPTVDVAIVVPSVDDGELDGEPSDDDSSLDGRSATEVITSPISTLDDKSPQADKLLSLPSQYEYAHRSPMPSTLEFNSAIAEAALRWKLAALVACACRALSRLAILS